ncbi:META domain-containing protein [Qipengyuania gaetbuli]|uniref:META domain-containing protein n=1 Tax=Qipengyuania gaetbuli TaxID=266952 RepID=UPI001CFF2F95|nr:META domain-containing protein [Qipengyuania gaetbuli]
MTHSHLYRMAALGAAGLALAGCESLPGNVYHPLNGTTWRLVDVETSGTSTRLNPELQARHTLTFERGGRVNMQLDCNRGSASWEATLPQTYNGSISISQVAATRAFCPDPTFGEALAADLPSSSAYTLTPDGRGLVIRTARIVYAFERN